MRYCLNILFLTSFVFLTIQSCKPYNYNVVFTTPGQQPDSEYCGAAESRLQTLCNIDSKKNVYCCQVVAPTKKGKSYKQFCEEKQTQSIFLNPRCVASISICETIDDCTNSR